MPDRARRLAGAGGRLGGLSGAAPARYQPLLSLHGHIHESRGQTAIGRTIAVNPGSEYGEGLLRGVIVTISGDTVVNVQMTSG